MLKHDSTPTLAPELELDLFDDYPDEVLECEWNPALAQVLQLRKQRLEYAYAEPQLLYADPPDYF